MYGGHITDYWDRRITNTYLQALLSPDLLDEKSGAVLAPGYAPPPACSCEFAVPAA